METRGTGVRGKGTGDRAQKLSKLTEIIFPVPLPLTRYNLRKISNRSSLSGWSAMLWMSL